MEVEGARKSESRVEKSDYLISYSDTIYLVILPYTDALLRKL